MIINVSEALLELIKTIEKRDREASTPDLNFNWSYYEDGYGASGEAWAYNPQSEYDVRVSEDGKTVIAQRRELGKYDTEGWETDELDSDYEPEEAEDE